MAVIPSFTGFAATPNLGSAFLGGVKISQDAAQEAARIGVQRERIAQEAQSDAARLAQASAAQAQQFQIARERIASSQVENQMRLEARQKIVDQQALQKSHEAAIEAAYKDTQLGLADRRLKNAEAISAMRIQEAADAFSRQQKYQRIIDAGGTPEQALREAGPGTPGYSKVVGQGFNPEELPKVDPATRAQASLLQDQIRSTRHAIMALGPAKTDKANDLKLSAANDAARLQRLLAPFSKPRTLSVPPTITGTNTPASMMPQRGLSVPEGLSRTNSKTIGRFRVITE